MTAFEHVGESKEDIWKIIETLLLGFRDLRDSI